MNRKKLHLDMQPQPDNTTCGPTCLQAVYRYFEDELPLEQVIAEIPSLAEGGTLAVLLGCHALRRGYRANIFTCNLNVLDPSWFQASPDARRHTSIAAKNRRLIEKLKAQMAVKHSAKLQVASQAYIEYLELGGRLQMQDLNAALLRRFLKRSIPVLTGLSATYLYQGKRELVDGTDDDIAGYPAGHFVVLSGYDKQRKEVGVADPYLPNPLGKAQENVHHYEVGLDRLICAILLGVLTYDANLLVIEPRRRFHQKKSVHKQVE